MRRLIVSDIHSNLEALEAVLRDAQGRHDEIICCGDVVGYNASPGEVVDWARESVHAIVRGNHDRVCSRADQVNDFNHNARAAASWTHQALDPAQLEWLRALPAGPLILDDYELAHGSPLDEDEYLVSAFEANRLRDRLERPLCFIGHTHLQGGWMWRGGALAALPRPAADEDEVVIDLDPDSLYLVNPGSVGQPRDHDPRAAHAIWDSAGRTITLRRTCYDIERAQLRIIGAGLPEGLAGRLSLGR